MWLAMVLLISLAMVLGLVLLLLAELYCSPLIRRRRNRNRRRHLQPTTTTGNNSDGRFRSQSNASSPLDTLTTPTDTSDDIEKQLHRPPENQDSGRTQHQDKSVNGCPFVYISNPVYDDDGDDDDDKTPFETPDTSPSRFDQKEDLSGDEEISSTPPQMKKLSAVACSVALNDGGRLPGTWGSDTNSNNGVSSSSSSTPCTSPSL
ncbi:hypothetical protein L6452_21568 [Arctium lappa]|uniref:Uncharacterized protein n=1 Tax=Arctium lappa TaxID=4217 RepID=A0ACB9B1S7_ARCLA|nr:hypothetical protein L6452_21568 [Arctium lappa]